MERNDLFEMLTKMHAFNVKQFDRLNDKIEQEISGVKHQMVRMEYELKEQIAILHDGVAGNTQAIEGLSNRMEKVEKTLEKHEIKLRIVK